MHTPAAWESMNEEEAQARLAHLRQHAAAVQDVYAAFTPWHRLSTGTAELDTLLSNAGVCGSGSSAKEGGGNGGFPVGGIHELYGPPLSGKSFLLRRVGNAYVRRMTAFRQWKLAELDHAQMWITTAMPSQTTGGGGAETIGSDSAASSASCGSPPQMRQMDPQATTLPISALATALQDWELYVCCIRGPSCTTTSPTVTGGGRRRETPATFSADVAAWQQQLLEMFLTSADDGSNITTGDDGCTDFGPARRTSRAGTPQPHQQRRYAETHTHLCEVTSPNELLDFLERLTSTSSKSLQRAQSLKRSRHEDSSSAVTSTNARKLETQRLLLMDGLERLWLHPALGAYGGTHAGQWFASELSRRLRCFVTPHCDAGASWGTDRENNAQAAFNSPPCSVYSTVLLTNGSQAGSYMMQTPPQLLHRLRPFCVAQEAVRERQRMTALVSPMPRPAGNAVWLLAVDTRCLVEPAHPDLLSSPSLGSTSLPNASTTQSPSNACSPYSPPLNQREAVLAGYPTKHGTTLLSSRPRDRPSHVPSFAAPTALESHVTVVHGGASMCSTWVQRCVNDEEGGADR